MQLARLFLCLLLLNQLDATEPEAQKFSKAASKKSQLRRQAILREARLLKDHAWAGEYFYGDGLGANVAVAVAPNAGFVFAWHGCLGEYDSNFGTVTSTNGVISLGFTFPNERKGFQGLAPELVPVRWKGRHYLVPKDEMVEFCNAVNSGAEPRTGAHGMFLLRLGDEKLPTSGMPEVPPEFRAYLLEHPVEAEIVAIGTPTTRPSVVEWKFKDIPVSLKLTPGRGLKVGMELHLAKPWDSVPFSDTVKVTRIDGAAADGLVTQIGEDDPMPKVGWTFSTLPPWRISGSKGQK